MAIAESNKVISNSGFEKKIDEGSMHMALDVLQKFQYQYPQKSTIRELAANAVDSIKERDIAKLIISGKAKEEDYYIRRDDPEFKDSNFNPSYFDLKWLSDKKEIDIIYEEGDGINKKDRLRILDEGVGLGGSRLELYFKLNASTKRNSKSAIGKWGLGAKVGLATGVDSYRVITRHNGKQFTFDVYSHKVDSITPKFGDNGVNPSYTFSNGYECYYENTTLKNGSEIIIETKKHHRSQYIEAVRSQLLYFDNVNFKVIQEGGYDKVMPVKAAVIYDDEDIILSDNNQYSRPHIVISNVCYGNIDFLELELDTKNGNIGIKMNAEDVDISPSRESIIWGDKTRKAVTDKFNKVVEIASKEVEKQLSEKDFLKWLAKCSSVLSSYDTTSILGRLSRVVDRSTLKPTYPEDRTIRYKTPAEMFSELNFRVVYKNTSYDYKKGRSKDTVERENLSSWNPLQGYKLYYSTGSASNIRDKYLLSAQDRFVFLQISEEETEEAFREKRKLLAADKLDEAWEKYKTNRVKELDILERIKKSELAVDYDSVLVPADFIKKMEEANIVDEEGNVTAEVIPEMSPAEKRKLDERTILYYPQKSSYSKYKTITDPNDATKTIQIIQEFDWIKQEPKISEVLEWENVVYCHGDEDEVMLLTAYLLEVQQANEFKNLKKGSLFFNDNIKFVRVSKSIKKYFKNHTHITEFYKNSEGTTLSMSNLFVKWYTAKRIADELVNIQFMNNFSMFNQEMYDKYIELKSYQQLNFVDLTKRMTLNNTLGLSDIAYKAVIEFADKASELQLFISNLSEEDVKDGDLIKSKSKEILGEEFTGSTGLDLEKYKLLQEVVEYATPLKNIFNHINPLVTKVPIGSELESEIKEIMRNKGYDN